MWFISVPLLVLMLLVVGITILVVKGGSIALRLTGLEESRANFQALSAVTGTGFTTRESELIMADPRRRKTRDGRAGGWYTAAKRQAACGRAKPLAA